VGQGFIVRAVVRSIFNLTKYGLVNPDKLTYAGNLNSLSDVPSSQKYTHEQVDKCDAKALDRVFQRHKPDCVMHLAAEILDRSIDGPADSIDTNIVGNLNLLEASRSYSESL